MAWNPMPNHNNKKREKNKCFVLVTWLDYIDGGDWMERSVNDNDHLSMTTVRVGAE